MSNGRSSKKVEEERQNEMEVGKEEEEAPKEDGEEAHWRAVGS